MSTSEFPRKAIIVAAGRGRRLGKETETIPKCMVSVGGRPILHWQLDALAAAGVTEFVVVRGYLGQSITTGPHRVRFIENAEWERNNILASLMHAQTELGGGFFFSYSDIVFSPGVATALAQAAIRPHADAALIIDRRWDEAYVNRTLHPVSEAELARVAKREGKPLVTRVGKRLVTPEEAAGEFIGLAWFSAEGARALVHVWTQARAAGGLDSPFGNAPGLRHAYLTDAINGMIAAGSTFSPVFIDGTWREIDTEQDLAAAERALPRWTGP